MPLRFILAVRFWEHPVSLARSASIDSRRACLWLVDNPPRTPKTLFRRCGFANDSGTSPVTNASYTASQIRASRCSFVTGRLRRARLTFRITNLAGPLYRIRHGPGAISVGSHSHAQQRLRQVNVQSAVRGSRAARRARRRSAHRRP